jgi:hypothetical protein
VVRFLSLELSDWWTSRNNAVHGMAKLHDVGDSTFNQRYNDLEKVALEGVRVLLRLDKFDKREKKKNGAGHAATWPDALRLTPKVKHRLGTKTAPTR